MVSLTQALRGEEKAPTEEYDVFEGPEKTVTLCFKHRKISAGSLRLIEEERWAEILQYAHCEILSHVESTSLDPACACAGGKGGKQKKVSTKGLTGYLLSESSLFLSDTTVTLKTCGRTTPLKSLEPILNTVVPTWRQKCPDEYLSYVSFSRLGYMFPADQIEPHTSWSEEVGYLNNFFKGESLVLGTEASNFHLYVANYLSEGEIVDAFSTQVALTNLDPVDSMANFKEGGAKTQTPLKSVWKSLHGDERRSAAANAIIDEKFFEPIGYSANGVFGRHFTTVHATPQANCSYVSVETSLTLTAEARQQFTMGVESWCRAGNLTLSEFSLCPKLFCRRDPPVIPGFSLQRSSQSVGPTFAGALHHYMREMPVLRGPRAAWPDLPNAVAPSPCASLTEAAKVREVAAQAQKLAAQVPVVEVSDPLQAAVEATGLFLETQDEGTGADHPQALLDVGAVKRQAQVWKENLPRVEPFYAVKCNGHPALLATLWEIWQEWGLGGFDCASPPEMAAVAALGVQLADKVVYANPCKQESAILFAKRAGIRWVVFDNAAELDKLHRLFPQAELLLRLRTEDTQAQCPLSNKFGAEVEDCRPLLEKAKALSMNVVGVSFHVGSGCSQRGAFRSAMQRARLVSDEMLRQGMELKVLDVGGGFPGMDEEGQVGFADHAADIRELLEELFPSPSIRVIAEPGRFFAACAQAILATVVSVSTSQEGCRYYINDGVYGSFNCLIYDHAEVPAPKVIRDGSELKEEAGEAVPCTVFGPTCDGFDVISKSLPLPELHVGDMLLFPNMGAYTSSASTSFNGFAPAAGWVYESKVL